MLGQRQDYSRQRCKVDVQGGNVGKSLTRSGRVEDVNFRRIRRERLTFDVTGSYASTMSPFPSDAGLDETVTSRLPPSFRTFLHLGRGGDGSIAEDLNRGLAFLWNSEPNRMVLMASLRLGWW